MDKVEENLNYFTSSDGSSKIAYYIYDNVKGEPKAVLQISHGMQEYITRYEPFIKILNKNGIIVLGNDHLGHGNTSTSKQTDGFFANKHGADYVLKDLYKMTQIGKEKFPDLPYILFGHSMGSFFARKYVATYNKIVDGLILCGTSGKVKLTNLALILLSLMKTFKGKKSHSKLVNKIMIKQYFRYIPNVETVHDWISSDFNVIHRYSEDNRTNFQFTVGAYYDMVKTLKSVNKKSWAKKVDKNLPILLTSGAQDPVGQYGFGVCQVYSLLEKYKVNNLDLKLYACGRHEPFNEVEPIKSTFINDILAWIDKVIKNKQ